MNNNQPRKNEGKSNNYLTNSIASCAGAVGGLVMGLPMYAQWAYGTIIPRLGLESGLLLTGTADISWALVSSLAQAHPYAAATLGAVGAVGGLVLAQGASSSNNARRSQQQSTNNAQINGSTTMIVSSLEKDLQSQLIDSEDEQDVLSPDLERRKEYRSGGNITINNNFNNVNKVEINDVKTSGDRNIVNVHGEQIANTGTQIGTASYQSVTEPNRSLQPR